MRRLAKNCAEAVLLGAGTFLGVRLAQTLADPFSDARLRASECVEHLRKVVTR